MSMCVKLLVVALIGITATAADPTSCAPENFVFRNPSGEMNVEEIRAHISGALGARPSANVLVNVEQLVGQGFTCLDGRSNEASLSAPGGDIGEFIVALKALETILHRPLGQFEIDNLLVHLLASGSRKSFHMCTDLDALQRLCQATRFCFPQNDLRLPPKNIQDELLTRLSVPDAVGCEHLRFMLAHPSLYEVRRELTAMAIRSFYRVLWNHLALPLEADSHAAIATKLDLTILQGPHEESGLVSVMSAETCPTHTLLLKPIQGDHSLRVLYPQALQTGRRLLAEAIAAEAVSLGLTSSPIDPATLTHKIEVFANTFLETSLAQLSIQTAHKEYPQREVAVPRGCCLGSFDTPDSPAAVRFASPDSQSQQALATSVVKAVCPSGSVTVLAADQSPSSHSLRLDGYSSSQVSAHFRVGSADPFSFVDAQRWGVTAMDGRDMESVLSVPGASLGQFAVVLSAIQSRQTERLDVLHLLSNYVLSMKAPAFSFVTDVSSLHAICSSLNLCPDANLPFQQRLTQLLALFQKPPVEKRDDILEHVTRNDGLYMGDAYLRFILSDKGLSRGRLDGSHLTPVETRLLKQLQQAMTQLAGEDENTLVQEWLVTVTERQVLSSVVLSFVDHDAKGTPASPLRQHIRIKEALSQCISDHPDVVNTLQQSDDSESDPRAVFATCRGALKRMVAQVVDEDGDGVDANGDTEKQRTALKSILPEVIRAFFQLLWHNPSKLYQPYADGIAAKMDLIVLEGQHHEHAFVRVVYDEACPSTLSPLLTPHRSASLSSAASLLPLAPSSSVWVYHELASRRTREHMVDVIASLVPALALPHKQEILGAANDLDTGNVHRFVFDNLVDFPVYDMVFTEDCCPEK